MSKNENNPAGTSPAAVRDGLAEINRRLYEAADNLGGGALADELESVARLAARLHADAEKATDPTPTPTPEQIRKAAAQILDMIENAWKPREQKELSEWIAQNLAPDCVADLAADYDESMS